MDELIKNSKWGFVPGLSSKTRMTRGKWVLEINGDLCFDNYYQIENNRLTESDWIIHLLQKDWFDFNEFMPIYLQACLNAGITEVTINTNY